VQREQLWAGVADQRCEIGVGVADLLGEVLVAAGEAAQRRLDGLRGVGELLVVGAQPRRW